MESRNFYYQYNESKQIAIDAIRHKLHVVLLGGPAAGKTYLTDELRREGYLNSEMYIHVYEGDAIYQYNPELQRFWIQTQGDLKYSLKLIKNKSFVVINMSEYKFEETKKIYKNKSTTMENYEDRFKNCAFEGPDIESD